MSIFQTSFRRFLDGFLPNVLLSKNKSHNYSQSQAFKCMMWLIYTKKILQYKSREKYISFHNIYCKVGI